MRAEAMLPMPCNALHVQAERLASLEAQFNTDLQELQTEFAA